MQKVNARVPDAARVEVVNTVRKEKKPCQEEMEQDR